MKKPTLFAVFEANGSKTIESVLNEFSTKNPGMTVISMNMQYIDGGMFIATLVYKLYD